MAHWIMIGRGLAAILIALGGFIAIMNWTTLITTRRTADITPSSHLSARSSSARALRSCPPTRHYAWAAILGDYGTLIVLYSLPRLVREAFETSRYNLLAEYRGARGIMTASISLFRGGICIIRHDMKRAPGELGMVSMSRVGMWSLDGKRLTVQVGDTSAEFKVVTAAEGEFLQQVSGFSGDADELSLAEVELLR